MDTFRYHLRNTFCTVQMNFLFEPDMVSYAERVSLSDLRPCSCPGAVEEQNTMQVQEASQIFELFTNAETT